MSITVFGGSVWNDKGKTGALESDPYFVQILAVNFSAGHAGQVTTLL